MSCPYDTEVTEDIFWFSFEDNDNKIIPLPKSDLDDVHDFFATKNDLHKENWTLQYKFDLLDEYFIFYNGNSELPKILNWFIKTKPMTFVIAGVIDSEDILWFSGIIQESIKYFEGVRVFDDAKFEELTDGRLQTDPHVFALNSDYWDYESSKEYHQFDKIK
jgi:hypothetical protein